MNREEFKKEICDIIDTMDDNECEKLSLQFTQNTQEQDVAQELIKMNGEFKKLTKIVLSLDEKEKQNIADIKPYIQMHKFLKNAQDILFSMPNANFFNLFQFNMNFGAFRVAYMDINQLFMDILEEQSLQPTAKSGEQFNAQFHEIVDTVNDNSLEEATIVDIVEQGFIYKDNLINYAKVIVNKKEK